MSAHVATTQSVSLAYERSSPQTCDVLIAMILVQNDNSQRHPHPKDPPVLKTLRIVNLLSVP